jgi:hypothetical protein
MRLASDIILADLLVSAPAVDGESYVLLQFSHHILCYFGCIAALAIVFVDRDETSQTHEPLLRASTTFP